MVVYDVLGLYGMKGIFGAMMPWLICLFVIVVIWDAVWKFMGMWKAAKNNSIPWFICIGIFNTIGILPILYIYVFSKKKKRSR